MSKSNHYTCITGASAGIGLEAAKSFAQSGSNLILVARRMERLEELKKEILKTSPDLDIVLKGTDLSVIENVYRLYEELKSYTIMTWINNAGFGNYDSVADQNLEKISKMIHLNIEALTLLSALYTRDYKDKAEAQLINVSSRGGYTLVPNVITYCATKFFVSAFTEGLARELQNGGHPMKVKVLAPAATKTEFGKVANDSEEFDYDRRFKRYHTSEQMAGFLMELYHSDKTVGLVDASDYEFRLLDPIFPYS